jgi:hypothetical protein
VSSTSVPRIPGRLGEHHGIPNQLDEPTFSSLGPTSHVNLLLDVKVISS